MSLLSRVTALLESAQTDPAPPALFTPSARFGAPLPPTKGTGQIAAVPARAGSPLSGPSGLGTSGLRIRPPQPHHAEPSTEQPAPQGPARSHAAVPPLYCPEPVRDDPALGALVNTRLIAWAGQVGIYLGQLDRVRAADFGRLVMLAHPDTEDPDRLLAAAKCALAEWATDDHYCDDESLGSQLQLLGSRLGLAYSAVESAQLPLRYAPQWEQGMREDPVLVALRSAFEHLTRYAEPSQLARLRHEIAVLFTGYSQEASWRQAQRVPPVWEYLAHRQINSFVPCLAVIDPVGGYRLPAALYCAPRVRRAVLLAGLAGTLVNDLYSMGKQEHGTGTDFNLPSLIAAEDECSLAEAAHRSAAVHDELMHTLEAEAAALALAGPPELKRFLAGLWAWLAGNHEWHRGTARYTTAR